MWSSRVTAGTFQGYATSTIKERQAAPSSDPSWACSGGVSECVKEVVTAAVERSARGLGTSS
jgi:hypothetical protein